MNKITFTLSKYRKPSKHKPFNHKLSPYWQKQYYDLFRRWS